MKRLRVVVLTACAANSWSGRERSPKFVFTASQLAGNFASWR